MLHMRASYMPTIHAPPTYSHTYLLTYPSTMMRAHTYPPTYLPTYLHTYISEHAGSAVIPAPMTPRHMRPRPAHAYFLTAAHAYFLHL
jgi:hypothetical protein